MASIQTYLQYTTPTGVKYYYDQSTKQTTYQFPSNSIIIDSKSKQIIYSPPGVKVKIADQQEAQIQNAVNIPNQSSTAQTNINPKPPIPFQNNYGIPSKLGPKSLQPFSQPVINPPSPTTVPNQLQSQANPPNPLQPQSIQIPPLIQCQTQIAPQPMPSASQFQQNPLLIPPAISTQNQPQAQQAPHQLLNPSTPPMNPTIPQHQVQQINTMQPQNLSIPTQFNPSSTQLQYQQNNTAYQQQQTYLNPNQQILNQNPQVLHPNQQMFTQNQKVLYPNPQISNKKSVPDIHAFTRMALQSSNSKTLTPSSSGDFQGIPSPNNQPTTSISLNPPSIISNRVPTPVNMTESIPMMPDFLVPAPVIHDFSPWTINTVDSPSIDRNSYVFPQITLSKDATTFQSDNPFNYPEKIQLSFNSSGSTFDSSFLDGIDGPSTLGDDESSSGRPTSVKTNSSLLINDIEIKTPYLVIEMIANSFKVSPNSIKTKSGFLELINKYQLTEYAQENFRKLSSTSSSKKGNISYDEELTFSDKPISKPLLKKLKSNLKPFGATISTSILQFMGVIQGYNQIIVAHNLCQIIYQHQDLIDETFFQIIKQATNNPNPNWNQNCCLLFLIICSFFKPRKSNRLYILSWAAHHLLDNNFKVREFFAFAMIRFESRFLRGTYKDEVTINMIKTIPSQVDKAYTLFDCSIFEIMWAQRKRYPHLPIPIPLALIIKELVRKNAAKTPNLLDLPSDNNRVEHIASIMLNDHKLIESLNVGDLMGLLKNWLLSISDPLISRSTYNNFLHYENPVEYTNCMPSAHRESLKFLVGFWQDIINNDEANNSTGSKLANVFGPLIVDPTELVHTQEIHDAIISRSSEFIKGILFSWQTNDIYPLPNEFLDQPKKEKFVTTRTSLIAQNNKGPQAKRNSVCPLRTPPISPNNSSGSIPSIIKE